METTQSTFVNALEITNKRCEEDDGVELGLNPEITLLDEFKVKHNPFVYILTPCYDGKVNCGYLQCLLQTIQYFNEIRIPLKIELCSNDSLITRARNNLVAKSMSNPLMTHVIFIDADIQWSPGDIVKLLLSDKSVCGGAYPLKKYDFDRLIPTELEANPVQKWLDNKKNSILHNTVNDALMIQSQLLKYNVNYFKELNIDTNVAKVRHLATGFLMIKRTVFEKMNRVFPEWKYKDNIGFLSKEEEEQAYAYFDTGVEGGYFSSEDWKFCNRWSELGGSIYLDVSIHLIHSGTEHFNGVYLTSLL